MLAMSSGLLIHSSFGTSSSILCLCETVCFGVFVWAYNFEAKLLYQTLTAWLTIDVFFYNYIWCIKTGAALSFFPCCYFIVFAFWFSRDCVGVCFWVQFQTSFGLCIGTYTLVGYVNDKSLSLQYLRYVSVWSSVLTRVHYVQQFSPDIRGDH